MCQGVEHAGNGGVGGVMGLHVNERRGNPINDAFQTLAEACQKGETIRPVRRVKIIDSRTSMAKF